MTLGIVDLIVIGITIISVLFALYRGLLRELLGISSWLLAGFAALYSYDPFFKFCTGTFENVQLAAILCSIALALFVLIVMTVVNAMITKRLRKSALSGLDRIFGLVFGVARAILIVALVYILMATMMLSPKYVAELKKQNYSVAYIETVANYIESVFPENIKEDLMTYQARTRQSMKEKMEKTPKAVVDYNIKERDSLNNMIEEIVEIGDLE